jgi:hypothetical protein
MDVNDLHPVDKQRMVDLVDALRALPDARANTDARILVAVLLRRYRNGDDSKLNSLIVRLRNIAINARREVFPQLALNVIVASKRGQQRAVKRSSVRP